MKLEINNSGTNSYYDEYLFLVQNYKKIYSNSNIKVKKSSSSAYLYLILSVVIFIGFLIWYLISKDIIQLCVTIFFAILILLSIILLCLIRKRINILASNYQKTIFEITEYGVSIENNKKYQLKFDEIRKILIGNYTITFVPNDVSKSFITTRIEYKNEIIGALKKYRCENLISNL